MTQKQIIPTEHEEQVRVVQWCDMNIVGRVYAIPNGGTRSHAYTAHLHMEGMRTGAPDLVIALTNGRTIWIEMKRASKRKSHVSDAQRAEHSLLTTLGHEVHVCYGADEAIAVIMAAERAVRPTVKQVLAVEAATKAKT